MGELVEYFKPEAMTNQCAALLSDALGKSTCLASSDPGTLCQCSKSFVNYVGGSSGVRAACGIPLADYNKAKGEANKVKCPKAKDL